MAKIKWHGYVADNGSHIYAKGEPLRPYPGMITADTRKELFAKLDKEARKCA